MYITITDIVGEKRIDLDYLILGKEVAVLRMFSDNVQYWVKKPLKLLLSNEEKMLPEGTFTSGELSTFMERNLIIIPLGADKNVRKINKLAGITVVVISLDKLNNTDNLENGRLSKVLLRQYLTISEEFMNFEPVTPQYKKLINGELSSLSLRIMIQNDNTITDGPGMTIVLHIHE